MLFPPHNFIPQNTNIAFVSKRWWGFGTTLVLMIATIISLSINGLNLGIDFKGGILIEAKSEQVVDMAALRGTLDNLGLGEISLQEFGSPHEVLIRVQRQEGDEDAQQRAVQIVREKLGTGYEYRRVEVVGPTVGKELFQAGVLASIFAVLAIAIYVGMRFEWQFGVAGFVSTLHDVFVTVGLYSFFQLDFNLTAVAALLTLAGYSINDTVVVFDRIREVLRRHKAKDLGSVIDASLNQTFSRTLMTGGTTLLALLPLIFFGGPTLLNFSVAIAWGILVGTYSSIYVASSLLLYMPPLRRIDLKK